MYMCFFGVMGFWLRGKGLGRFTLPFVSGGSVESGRFRDCAMTLKKGTDLYSYPLNPTPDDRLLAE